MNVRIYETRRLLALAAGLVLWVGCESSSDRVNSVERAVPVGQRQMLMDRRIIRDPGLADQVWVVGLNQAMTPTGLLKVVPTVQLSVRVARWPGHGGHDARQHPHYQPA